ncbi:MAG: gamma carbonic anhydrase family protein [Chloroflexi bacterium]|nr:gamma carbonic anhydrase family protein [Chloroflexota bacterium]
MQVLESFMGKMPHIPDSCFVSDAAYIMGDIEFGEGCSVWPGAVIRGDAPGGVHGSQMIIGNNTHIEDNVTVHFTKSIGDRVVMGHGAVVEAYSIGNNVLIGDNATLLAYSKIGDNCIIAAGSTVTEGMEIPDNSFVTGSPAKIKRATSEKQMEMLEELLSYMPPLIAEHKQNRCDC